MAADASKLLDLKLSSTTIKFPKFIRALIETYLCWYSMTFSHFLEVNL